MFIVIFALIGVGLYEVILILPILALLIFIFSRRIYRRRFAGDPSKVMVWSIITALLLTPVAMVVLLLLIFGGLMLVDA